MLYLIVHPPVRRSIPTPDSCQNSNGSYRSQWTDGPRSRHSNPEPEVRSGSVRHLSTS